jgi:hypothetical protein
MGYIRLDRKILEWEWYSDKNTKDVFIHCLLKANWKEGKFQGKKVERGSFITSISTLANECGLSPRSTRTALEHLKTTGELTIKSNNKYSVITVTNYDYYQTNDTQDDNQKTCKQKKPESQQSKDQINISEKKNGIQDEAEELFLRLWKLYPFMKTGKSSISSAKKRKIYTEVGEEQFIRCIERLKEHKGDTDPKYIPRASTFFNTTYIDYLDQNYKETMGIIDDTPFVVDSRQVKRKLQ